ncbi:SAM-dependent methyltransferase [Peterkaempfera bronchialis]|uniref:SAM-dependent methyltransferase n=1 Tax=Peterkaempfera bronchialis TaxID=2126346 RepID=A0A345T1K5_9ACTN|nr:SAM-dependent methyltransferase [Peterkaempfera bronchialis]AXI79860.1 SAM-dependent methyltransferase [Peterkaempfera bronchialis]
MAGHSATEGWAPTGIDTSVPSIARVYDAMLGGKDNFAVDRAVAEKVRGVLPISKESAWEHREVLARGVRYLTSQGIDQFLDLGSGLPTVQNTHQVAQAANPKARVVYVDNDPIVLTHGRALLAGDARTKVVTADLRDPADVLSRPEVRELIDLDRPLGLLLVGVVHHLADTEDPAGVVKQYLDAAAPGSFLFLTHFRSQPPTTDALEQVFLSMLGSGRFRTQTEIEALFEGLEMVEPGVVELPRWRPDGPLPQATDGPSNLIAAGAGRKPAV